MPLVMLAAPVPHIPRSLFSDVNVLGNLAPTNNLHPVSHDSEVIDPLLVFAILLEFLCVVTLLLVARKWQAIPRLRVHVCVFEAANEEIVDRFVHVHLTRFVTK